MKKRLIPRKNIEKAYRQELESEDLDLSPDSSKVDIDKLPKEVFEILGELVSFIEVTSKFKGDGHENQ